ncbi:MAG TPA: hypothetical protein ENI20_07630 [Bacteroides sp.]|nr:hypothetical protein [Bacteroides sp.]
MEQGKDPYTQEIFFKKRSNQRFANSLNRIRYNNLKAKSKRNAMAPVNTKLFRNRKILETILGAQKEVTVSRDYLLGSGFSFDYFSYQKEINNVVYFGIYEFGIARLGDNNYKIIRLLNGQTV